MSGTQQATEGQRGQMMWRQDPHGGVGSPISNEAYNVLSALHTKLEGLEAYRKYQHDGSGQIWQQLSQQDNQAVEMLVQELERLVKTGGFRTKEPGRAG
jgi:hypothetical protein